MPDGYAPTAADYANSSANTANIKADRALRAVVKHLRLDHKLTFKEIAERTGMHVKDVRRIVNQ